MLIRNGIRNLEGDGCNTLFWKDLWLREIRLKDKFPRLFSISLLKNSPISECGAWDGCVWHQNLTWRREFFEWELDQLYQLQGLLDQARLIDDQANKVLWSFDNSGNYSVRSFIEKTYQSHGLAAQDSISVSRIWCGIVPPKAKLLLWFVVQRRLNTKDRLRRLNMLRVDDCSVFCVLKKMRPCHTYSLHVLLLGKYGELVVIGGGCIGFSRMTLR